MKQCPNCGAHFTADDLINHAEIEPLGMCFEDDDITLNLFYFNHNCAGCGTTFTVHAQEFAPFITEPISDQIRAGQPTCDNHCTNIRDLSVCQNECRWAPFRRFLLSLLSRRGLLPTAANALASFRKDPESGTSS